VSELREVPLTAREIQVARLVARGMTNRAIAQSLELSVETVNDHIRNAAARLPGDGRPKIKLIIFVLGLPKSA
jgi:non-specific serine/threonine protein kinase